MTSSGVGVVVDIGLAGGGAPAVARAAVAVEATRIGRPGAVDRVGSVVAS